MRRKIAADRSTIGKQRKCSGRNRRADERRIRNKREEKECDRVESRPLSVKCGNKAVTKTPRHERSSDFTRMDDHTSGFSLDDHLSARHANLLHVSLHGAK